MIRIVTAADDQYFTRLIAMIGSVIRNHEDGKFSISVYNIGLTSDQLDILMVIPGVEIFVPEKVNPFVTTKFKKHQFGEHRHVPGLYTWKPVAVKMEIEKCEQVLWLDAGVTVCRNLSPMWEHTRNVGYFFIGVASIDWQTTKKAAALCRKPEILKQRGLNSSSMGITRSVYESFVIPSYECAKDLELFRDDGSAGGGPTSGRHDQTIFSIMAANSGLHIHESGLYLEMITDSGTAIHSIVANREEVSENTLIYQSRGNSDWNGDYSFMKKRFQI